MSALIRTETITFTVGYLVDNFTGRRDWKDYDPTKVYHIHKRNRAYVWTQKMVEKLFDTIMKGYFILPLVCHSIINNGKETREIMDGGNRLTAFAEILLHNKVGVLTQEEIIHVRSFPITIVVMYNLTSHQVREQFRRLSAGKQATPGQLYQMSQDDSPLIQEAIAFMKDINYPLRERCIKIFTDFFTKEDTDAGSRLANIIGIISGAVNGVRFISTSFDKQEERVENNGHFNRELLCERFNIVLQIFEKVDKEFPLARKNEKKEQFTLGNLIGPILYDIHECQDHNSVIEKWSKYILQVRERKEKAKEACDVTGAQNLNPDKLAKKSYKVHVFIQEDRIVPEDELKQIKHIYRSAEDVLEEVEEDETPK